LADLSSPDGRLRLSAIQVIKVDDASFPMISGAMADDKASVRRWAAAVLGSSGRSEAVEPLCTAVVSDPSVIVRRAAGDSLSDLGFPEAIPAMCQALSDASHLVRWRAARYLNEMGDESALEALDAAIATESDFGIRLEMNTAKERIQSGGESQVPMWLRLARGAKQKES
jgi:HEAT repeat protein